MVKLETARDYAEAARDKSLLPCPFCGCELISNTRTRSGADVGECFDCHALAPYETWNRRAASVTENMVEAALDIYWFEDDWRKYPDVELCKASMRKALVAGITANSNETP